MRGTMILSLMSLGCLTVAIPANAAQPGGAYPAMTGNGAWCWFSDPRAIYVPGDKPQIVTGWVKNDGTIEAGSLSLKDGAVTTQVLNPQLEFDDHNNPAYTLRADGRIVTLYTRHGKTDLYCQISDKPGDISAWSAPAILHPNDPKAIEAYKVNTYTYANPWPLSGENDRIYCFGRWAGYKPNYIYSDDGGETWSPTKAVVVPQPLQTGNRPYVKYYSDGKKRMHMLFTDGHPRNEPTNSVYYTYYEAGAFHRADGAVIRKTEELPFEPKDASLVYDATKTGARAWVWDMCADAEGRPVVLYTQLPEETDHRYHYARYDGERWVDHEICKAGGWFPQTQPGKTEREPHYSPGMTLDPNRPGTVYLARHTEKKIELECWKTPDGGATWTHEPITADSEYDQIRPFVPRGLPADGREVVLWMQNKKYIHYTDYDCSIRYRIK